MNQAGIRSYSFPLVPIWSGSSRIVRCDSFKSLSYDLIDRIGIGKRRRRRRWKHFTCKRKEEHLTKKHRDKSDTDIELDSKKKSPSYHKNSLSYL